MECEFCNTPNDSGNYDPCCYIGFSRCDHGESEPEDTIGMCIHCGAEMFKENGYWFHHSQENIPFEQRKRKFDY